MTAIIISSTFTYLQQQQVHHMTAWCLPCSCSAEMFINWDAVGASSSTEPPLDVAPVTKVWELTVSNAVPQLRIGGTIGWRKLHQRLQTVNILSRSWIIVIGTTVSNILKLFTRSLWPSPREPWLTQFYFLSGLQPSAAVSCDGLKEMVVCLG